MLPADAFTSASALMAQRFLATIYEADLLFLPAANFARLRGDFELFYADATRLAGERIRPALERHVFGFLEEEIEVTGLWTREAMAAFFQARLIEAEEADGPIVKAILGAKNTRAAAEQLLAQLASDYLTEASAMARNTLGNWGVPQSSLFKVLIDEYGYGVHEAKHSSLFSNTLQSVGLSGEPHAYWQFTLPSSLALLNYFHLVARNHTNIFRYAGAVYYTEATLAAASRAQSVMLKKIFGEKVDTRYFDEHAHIDQHHGRMVAAELIDPLLERCGDSVIPEIIRGFEEFRMLQEMADADLVAQITWSDALEAHRRRGTTMLADVPPAQARFTEPHRELSVPHVHDEDEVFAVEEGEIELVAGPTSGIRLTAGEAIVIPQGRLHGSLVLSERCTYAVHPLRYS